MRPNVLASSHLTLLHHFVYSVFIHTHLISPPLPSPPHNLPSSHHHNHHHRLKLCNRLLQALKVCGHIEEPSLCLQGVVMAYGLLAPLLQRDIRTPFIAEVRKNTHQHSHSAIMINFNYILVLSPSLSPSALSLSLLSSLLSLSLLSPSLSSSLPSLSPSLSLPQVLLHCQCVLEEIPDHLPHSHSPTQSALHHMIATSAFHLNKVHVS